MTGMRIGRRGARAGAALLLAALLMAGEGSLAGCTRGAGTGQHYEIAGGVSTGVYYGYGKALAAALQREIELDISAVETDGSVDNLLRVGEGEALLGFAQGDTAADAVAGVGAFPEPLPIRAVARVYDEYVHIVVPADSDAETVDDLAGRTVSLGAPNSGVHVIATRVLEASDVPIDAVANPALGLDQSIAAMQRGEIDGFFWVGGLPTPGIEALEKTTPIRLIPVEAETVERVNAEHAGVYRLADFPLGIYGEETPTVTMTVPNYLVTNEAAPDRLIGEATRVLFASRGTMARDVAAAQLLDRRQAIFTGPIELHPGAAAYYIEAHR